MEKTIYTSCHMRREIMHQAIHKKCDFNVNYVLSNNICRSLPLISDMKKSCNYRDLFSKLIAMLLLLSTLSILSN